MSTNPTILCISADASFEPSLVKDLNEIGSAINCSVNHRTVSGIGEIDELLVDTACDAIPGLVVLDAGSLSMSAEDIRAFARRLQPSLQSPAQPPLRIVVVASPYALSSIGDAVAEGVFGHLPADYARDELLAAVQAACGDTLWYSRQLFAESANKFGAGKPVESALSPRELEVVQLVVAGRTNVQVASALGISTHTVKTHVRNLMQKLAVNNRSRLALVVLTQVASLAVTHSVTQS